jgi:Mg2+ and Co2+ transporter CorA
LNQVRSDLQSGRRLPDVLGLFHALVHELASAISFVLNELGAKLNEMEERLLDQKEVGSDVLGQARRRLVRVRRQALPLRAVLIHTVNERPYWFDDDAVVTGIFGMNVTGLPFQKTAYGFWVACGLLAASMTGMLVVLRRFRLI